MSEDGRFRKKWSEIDFVEDEHWLHPADPALVSFIAEQSGERQDVDRYEVSASQLETGVRQMLLQETVDYYVTAASQTASIMGTMKHSMVNVERPGFITETRLWGPYGSAKCDTLYVPLKWLVDLKAIGWYKVKQMLQDVMTHGVGYVYQINLFRVLLKDPANQDVLLAKYPWLKREDIGVERMTLTCVPRDMNYINKKEAAKLIDGNPSIISILVPFVDDDKVLSAYETKQTAKALALNTGTAELCSPEERWQKGATPVKCKAYCPVVEACMAMSAARGEQHPMDRVQVAA
jgi:hypothetical protein